MTEPRLRNSFRSKIKQGENRWAKIKGTAMRLTFMKRSATILKPSLLAAALLLGASLPAVAQLSAPPNQGNTFKDTSMVKPPAGAKVAIYEFEDLECPACAHAFPIVHEAIERYHIPLVRHDFPLKMHIWSFDAAVTARYLQDKVSPKIAEDFRRDVFANQMSIASKDDLQAFTRRWFVCDGPQRSVYARGEVGLYAGRAHWAEPDADDLCGDDQGMDPDHGPDAALPDHRHGIG
jgi:hypothetical protein